MPFAQYAYIFKPIWLLFIMKGLKMVTYNEICEQYTLPLLPVRGIIAFPGVPVSVEVGRAFSKKAIDVAQRTSSFVYLVAQRDQNEEDKILSNVENVGVIAKIKQVITANDGNLKVVFEGICRAETNTVSHLSGYYVASVTSRILEIEGYSEDKAEALLRRIRKGIKSIVSLFPLPSKDFATKSMLIEDLDFLCDFTASNLLVKLEDKQAILDKFNKYERAELLVKILAREARIIKLEAGIQRKTKERIDESQREYYLREQLKVIQSELGNDSQNESEELYEEIIAKKFPKAVEEKLLKELYKFNKAPFGTPEATVLRTYLETCLEIPFGKFSKDATDVSVARRILEEDHYGLQKVKERILEFIAVKELNPEVKKSNYMPCRSSRCR